MSSSIFVQFVSYLMLLLSVVHDAEAFATTTSMPTPLRTLDLKAARGTSIASRASSRFLLRRYHGSVSSSALGMRSAMSKTAATSTLGSVVQKLIVATRGGAASVLSPLQKCTASPQALFNTSLAALALVTVVTKVWTSRSSGSSESKSDASKKPDSYKSLQRRFLAVFWLLRCSDWLQGPYFYEVYASKVLQGGAKASMQLISKLFLTGFASTAVFGPSVGRAADAYGRKRATIAFCLIYALGAISTKSNLLPILFAGRMLSGIGTSLLFSAPEAWLVGESQSSKDDPDGKYLGETFGLAYAGDSIVAILAGQMAATAAASRGPTGAFELSTMFLAAAGVLTAFLWTENKATKTASDGGKPSIREAIQVVREDKKILLVGGVQSLFEAAMYIFVLQWPPALSSAIERFFANSGSAATPYGTVFSCFMACCLLGSTIFGQLAKTIPAEHFTTAMLALATTAMSAATWAASNTAKNLMLPLIAAFFVFEACVGMYFPSIGTLRSKYVPDSHRSVIMNLFGIPLNVLVVSVFLSISRLGINGALAVSSTALGLATMCMLGLERMYVRGKVADEPGV